MSDISRIEWQQWQQRFNKWKQRVGPTLRSGHLADCSFQVGTEPNLAMVSAHKLVLSTASPVFESMFYGKMAENNDFVRIPDIQPNAFKIMLNYIYTNDVNITSIELAYELYYGAKKYMLENLVKVCSEYLKSEVNKENVCGSYEFGLLFEDKQLINECLDVISANTVHVLNSSNFEEMEFKTLLTILSQDVLAINHELELFKAVERYAKVQEEKKYENSLSPIVAKYGPSKDEQEKACDLFAEDILDDDHGEDSETTSGAAVEKEQSKLGLSGDDDGKDKEDTKDLLIRTALKMIRFLAMTPKEFADGPARSKLLKESEVLAVLMNIVSTESCVPMPEGWSTCRKRRKAYS